MILSADTVISRNSDILANEVGQETVMMSIQHGKYFGTNKTGSYIWKVLETPTTFAELCTRLAADFNISQEKCAEEVMPFIEEMNNENIITIK